MKGHAGKALVFVLVLLGAAVVAHWTAAFSAHLFGMDQQQWLMGGVRLALINWALTIIVCPIAFFTVAQKSDLYAASAAGILIPGALGLITASGLLWLG